MSSNANKLPQCGESKELGLKSKLTFGTHKGTTIAEVIKEHPDYIEWCIDTIYGFELDINASEALEKALGLDDDLEGIFR